ncbi:MAG TPA: M48 family metallopeptidase [Vicinamibacterales bacterium]|nr:M48 family metallopeptidase [Vicinamibacterales bacterium]
MTALTGPSRQALTALMLALAVSAASAQTPITPDKNKYTPAQDVQIGQEASQEVRRELPMLKDARVDDYVDSVGARLVRAIPPQFQHSEFRYSFEVVNQKEINAFALPGGPMFLHRGMMEAAKSEGEMAGVMAHEIAHVALRHGTAQATKAQGFQIGAVAGQILGAIVGGTAGSIIAQGSQFGLGAYFLKYGREYEREADLLGAQIMARAGYDPRRMADMFRTIEKQSKGSGGPEWLSSHPHPANRYEAIQNEASMLRIEGTAPSQASFQSVQKRLRSMAPAYTAEQIARARQQGQRLPGTNTGGARDDVPVRTGNVRVSPPSGQYQRVAVGNFMRMQVPTNWGRVEGNSSVTFAPEGGHYRTQNGATGFTHGLQIGVIPNESHSHQHATDELIESLQQGNPQIRRQSGGYVRENIGGRTALSATLRNVSEVSGGAELVTVSTVPLRDGSLLYLIAVAPQDEANAYSGAFRRIKQSVQLSDTGR